MKYFGTDLTTHGHYIWNVGQNYLSDSSIDFRGLSFDPEGLNRNQQKGEVTFLHTKDNMTVLAICGSCVDNRPGTKSVFWVPGILTKDDMILKIKSYPVLSDMIVKMESKFKIQW
jgi:phage-related protein